jgi:hypothetical protein
MIKREACCRRVIPAGEKYLEKMHEARTRLEIFPPPFPHQPLYTNAPFLYIVFTLPTSLFPVPLFFPGAVVIASIIPLQTWPLATMTLPSPVSSPHPHTTPDIFDTKAHPANPLFIPSIIAAHG